MSKKKSSYVGDVLSAGVSTMVGVGMMGATADMVSSLPAGTAKTIAGTTVGLQGIALLGPNIKLAKKSMGEFW